jgi:predicted transcriptional regulator with HTH domain
MAIVTTILVILHFIGLSYLLGSFLVEIKDVVRGQGKVMRGMLDGALLQLITGVALVGIYSAGLVEGEEVNNTKITFKLAIAVIVYVLALVFRKRIPAPSAVLWTIGGLTLVNVILAVAWK